MSIKKSVFLIGAALSMAAFLNGCSSSSKEGGSLADVPKVGDAKCTQCHAATADPLTGETFVTQYSRSLHAELGCESCHGGGGMHNGVGPFPYELNSEVSDAKKAERCKMCHDGVTTVKNLRGVDVVAPLSSSNNFSNGNHANPFGTEEVKEAKCARCHSHEGSILYGKDGFTGDKTIMDNTSYQPVLSRNPETFNPIKCATCHEHGGNIRLTKTRDLAGNIVTWDPDKDGVVTQYDLCTSCHNMTTNAGKLIGSGNVLAIAKADGTFTNVSTVAFYHNSPTRASWYRTLPSTHVDQKASTTVIEGYVIRKNHKNPCFECHGHEFKANTRALAGKPERGSTTFTDWALSGHAGQLLSQKIAAAALPSSTLAEVDDVMKAGVVESTGAAWIHYNWDSTFKADGTSDRGACQRCHTSTGASNFMKNPAAYNYANNDFSHLADWKKGTATLGVAGTATTSSGQNELLYCWGCHSNAGTGKLYAPGARVETYAVATTGDTPVTISYPDIAGSNVCMTCHLGREVGDTIKNDNDADGVRGFVNSHYLAAGGQLFGKTGYTFTGRDYTNPSYFAHDKIGSAAAPGTGSNGPCVGCHMSSPNKHRFTNVSTSGGVITAITSTACATCHAGTYALTPAKLETEAEEYNASLDALASALALKGIYFYKGANPYFFTAPYVVGGTNTSYTNWAGPYAFAGWKDTMGAAFNLNLLAHDPGGYAHNRMYVKRLIWDSLDFINDGTVGNVTSMNTLIDSLGLPAATATSAKTYLGDTRP